MTFKASDWKVNQTYITDRVHGTDIGVVILADPVAFRTSSRAELKETKPEDVQAETLRIYNIEQNSEGYTLDYCFYFPE